MFKTIKNVIKWWPILKEDQDWDYSYLLKVIEFKLNNMATFFESDGAWTEGASDMAKEMRLCAHHLNRLIEDNFFDFDSLDEKWGKWNWDTSKEGAFSIKRPNVITDEDEIEFDKDIRKAFADEAESKQQTLNNFCQLLKDKIWNWWD